jgi:hypothetical protein
VGVLLEVVVVVCVGEYVLVEEAVSVGVDVIIGVSVGAGVSVGTFVNVEVGKGVMVKVSVEEASAVGVSVIRSNGLTGLPVYLREHPIKRIPEIRAMETTTRNLDLSFI